MSYNARVELVAYLRAQNMACASRIYPGELPQGALMPAITYNAPSQRRVAAQGAQPGLTYERMQFNCFADNPGAAEQLRDELDDALDGRTFTQGGIMFGTQRAGGSDVRDPTVNKWRRVADFEVSHDARRVA